MIISASRRTDIPAYYSEWLFNRIKEGFVYVRNPMNPRQISRIEFNQDVVDCIVFWTKNPGPMLERLSELQNYAYYFQFTLTGYGRDVETDLPHKKEKLIPVFRRLSEQAGSRRVIWRYDPILFTNRYTPEYHLFAFGQIAEALKGCTGKCIISFLDSYAKNRKALAAMGVYVPEERELKAFVRQLGRIAGENGMTAESCAETMDLRQCGIEHSCCIDKKLIEEITGFKMDVRKDRNQRAECGCCESVDIGVYNTCRNGCRYCYANHSRESVMKNSDKYDPLSPLLCGEVREGDTVTLRRMKPLRETQMNLEGLEPR